MKTAGLIAEFNPMHRGHVNLINRMKSEGICDRVVVLMSGDYVQRGTPAILDRRTRARIALENGADMVISYPTRYAASSAESFASHGVALLDKTGICDSLIFGSECGDIDQLTAAALVMERENRERNNAGSVRSLLEQGYSYPKAISLAHPELSDLLSGANNTLGIEYLRALSKQGSSIKPCTLKREGSGHQTGLEMPGADLSKSFNDKAAASVGNVGCVSSGLIRAMMTAGTEAAADEIKKLLPEKGYDLFLSELSAYRPADESLLDQILISELIKLPDASVLLTCPDIGQDLANRIYDNRYRCRSFASFAAFLKNKSLTRARLNRVLLSLALGIRKKKEDGIDLYLQVLGCRKDSLQLMSALTQKSSLPVITGHADALKKLTGAALLLYLEEVRVSNLYRALRCRTQQDFLCAEQEAFITV